MKSIHSRKIANEKDAFARELFRSIPRERQVVDGDLSRKAQRLHERFFPLHILAHYRDDSRFITEYFNAVLSHSVECECLLTLGFRTAGMTALRAAVEASMKFLYYETHPIEAALELKGQHDMTNKELREFVYVMPGLSDLPFIAKDKTERMWRDLCRYVHSDLRTIATISVVDDINSALSMKERHFKNLLDDVTKAMRVVVSCLFAAYKAWLGGVEKAYFDAVLELYQPSDRATVKEKLGIV